MFIAIGCKYHQCTLVILDIISIILYHHVFEVGAKYKTIQYQILNVSHV